MNWEIILPIVIICFLILCLFARDDEKPVEEILASGDIAISFVKHSCVLSLNTAMITTNHLLALKLTLEKELSKRDQETTFIVDGSRVEFFSDVTLAPLFVMHKLIRETPHKIHFVFPNKNIRQIFKVTKLDKVLQMFDNLEEAMLTTSSPSKE